MDGFNLFHGIKELGVPRVKWLNLWALAHSLTTQNDTLNGVVYFTAIADWNPDKARRHRKYIAALRTVNVEIVESRFQRVDRRCVRQSRVCPFQEEKETDVAFATRVLVDALTDKADKQILITADTDHVPMLKEVRRLRPQNEIHLAGTESRLGRANSLKSLATKWTVLHTERFDGCKLPQTVVDATGKTVATCPAKYLAA